MKNVLDLVVFYKYTNRDRSQSHRQRWAAGASEGLTSPMKLTLGTHCGARCRCDGRGGGARSTGATTSSASPPEPARSDLAWTPRGVRR
jgi:hypothetical protein